MCSRLVGGGGARNGLEMDGRSHFEMDISPARPLQMGPRFDAMEEVTRDGNGLKAELSRRGREVGRISDEMDDEGVGKAQKLQVVSRRGRKSATGWLSRSSLA